jgi:hypothetical protein
MLDEHYDGAGTFKFRPEYVGNSNQGRGISVSWFLHAGANVDFLRDLCGFSLAIFAVKSSYSMNANRL